MLIARLLARRVHARLVCLICGTMLALMASVASAQQFTGEELNPKATPDAIPVFETEPISLVAVLAEDEDRALAGLPPRFAIPNPVFVTPTNSGAWQTREDGSMRWRLRISAPQAASINLGFTRYAMPPGGTLEISAGDGSSVLPPFTARDNETHGELWTPIVQADEILLQVTVADADEANDLELELTSINHGYRGFDPPQNADSGADPRSGACNVDVVCPQGNAWQNEIPSVAVISTGGSLFCTGFMVNNTSNDQTPYFMTADHCGIGPGNAASLVTYWNYETSVCGGTPNGSLSQFMTGSFFRSAYSPSDFTLVELDDTPPPAYGITFAGWDRSGANASSAVAIHHPSTDEKRISFENNPTTTTSYFGTSVPGDGTHVRVADWDEGTTEGGSSGSPLFNQSHRVIGQLHGGTASCSSQTSDWYGRFSVSWTGGGTNSSRLSNWLDPGSTGATTVNTLVPGSGPVCGNNVIESGEQCDDGNTTPGDGCDANCQIEVSGGDECGSCISTGNGTVSGTTADNTGTTDDTSCTSGDTVDEWYCYTATCTGTATASTCNAATNYDTAIAVFDGCTGAELDCNDDAVGSPPECSLGGLNRKSNISWSASAGSTYYVRVSGYSGATGNFDLTITCTGGGGGPANDNCAGATPVGDGITPITNVGATTDGPDEPADCTFFSYSHIEADVWYAYTASCNGDVTVDLCGSSYDTKLAVYAGCPTGSGQSLACNDDYDCDGDGGTSDDGNVSQVRFSATSGTTYRIRIGGYNAAEGTGTMNISCQPTGATNDSCSGATGIACTTSIATDNTTATPAQNDGGAGDPELPAGSPSCQWDSTPTDVHNTLWYSFVAADTSIEIQTCATSAIEDTILALYDGTCGSLVELDCSEDVCGAGNAYRSQICYDGLTPGNTYRLVVGNPGSWTGSLPGPINLDLACPCPAIGTGLGACCLSAGGCVTGHTAASCASAGGTFQGAGSTCSPDPCPPTCSGPADGDIDGDGQTNGDDIHGFSSAVMAGSTVPDDVCSCDFDGSGTVDVGDTTGMVSALLSP